MKRLIIFIFCPLLFFCCQGKIEKEEIRIYDKSSVKEVHLNKDINLLIENFIKSVNNSDCIYELYIDKKTEDEYFITLFNLPNDSSYFTNHSPINYTVLNNKLIFIYTGLEDFIAKELYKPKKELKEYYSMSDTLYNTISMVIKKDTSYIVGSIGLPFSKIDFLPPIYLPEE